MKLVYIVVVVYIARLWSVVGVAVVTYLLYSFLFFKQKTAYEMRISNWSSDVCSSDLLGNVELKGRALMLAVTSAERAKRGTALIKAQSAPSCDFGQVGERFGNVAFGIDDGNHRRGQFAPS